MKMRININPVRRSGIQLELLVLFFSLLYLVSYMPNMTELVNRVLPQVHMSNINGIYTSCISRTIRLQLHYVNVGDRLFHPHDHDKPCITCK